MSFSDQQRADVRAGGVSLAFAVASCQFPPGLVDVEPAYAAYRRLETLLLGRISSQLAAIAECSQSLQDKMIALDVIARLIGIEAELRERAAVRQNVC